MVTGLTQTGGRPENIVFVTILNKLKIKHFHESWKDTWGFMWDIDFYKIIKKFWGQNLIEVEWSYRGTGDFGLNPRSFFLFKCLNNPKYQQNKNFIVLMLWKHIKETKYMIFIILSFLF